MLRHPQQQQQQPRTGPCRKERLAFANAATAPQAAEVQRAAAALNALVAAVEATKRGKGDTGDVGDVADAAETPAPRPTAGAAVPPRSDAVTAATAVLTSFVECAVRHFEHTVVEQLLRDDDHREDVGEDAGERELGAALAAALGAQGRPRECSESYGLELCFLTSVVTSERPNTAPGMKRSLVVRHSERRAGRRGMLCQLVVRHHNRPQHLARQRQRHRGQQRPIVGDCGESDDDTATATSDDGVMEQRRVELCKRKRHAALIDDDESLNCSTDEDKDGSDTARYLRSSRRHRSAGATMAAASEARRRVMLSTRAGMRALRGALRRDLWLASTDVTSVRDGLRDGSALWRRVRATRAAAAAADGAQKVEVPLGREEAGVVAVFYMGTNGVFYKAFPRGAQSAVAAPPVRDVDADQARDGAGAALLASAPQAATRAARSGAPERQLVLSSGRGGGFIQVCMERWKAQHQLPECS